MPPDCEPVRDEGAAAHQERGGTIRILSIALGVARSMATAAARTSSSKAAS